MIKAVLFDMDGVLTDSEPCHVKAYVKLFARHGVKLTKNDTTNVAGMLDEHIIKHICDKRGISCPVYAWGREKRTLISAILSTEPLVPYPGVLDLVKRVSRKYKVGLGTSSTHMEVDVTLRRIGLCDVFEKILAKEDVHTHKPSPEIYRKLALALGVRPRECVVIEDSIAGVEAAKRAGAYCIAVLNSYPRRKLTKADLIVRTLADKRITELLRC